MTEPIIPEQGSRLEQLIRTRAAIKPQLDELNEQFEAIKAGIKYEMASLRPGESPVTLVSPLLPKPLTLTAKTSRRINTKRLKQELPDVYEDYAEPQTQWELR